MAGQRLSPLDASFLHLEDAGAHMHVGSVIIFEGRAPDYQEVLDKTHARLDFVPRYRQKLAYAPLIGARPVWIDDPHFNPGYHIRHTALPAPAGEQELKRLAGRIFAQRLDRSKPLWEMWLVDSVQAPAGHSGDHFALITKTHHCLVDGVSGVDIATVMFDLEPDPPAPPAEPEQWLPRPEPPRSALLADALTDRAAAPLDAARAAGEAVTNPGATAARITEAITGLGSFLRAGMGAPPSPINVPIGPHRRFEWVAADLNRVKAIKSGLGGTVNDVVLTAVAGALRTWLLDHGHEISDLTLKAMVPVSIRAEAERGALGNRVTTMSAPLPVSVADPGQRFRIVHEAMAGLKESGQAVGADVLTRLSGFAPPTVLAQAARLQGRQRLFNLTVTNVPGPQFSLYMLGRRLLAIHPQVPLMPNTALGIAIMSYDGALNFGLISDYDALEDLDAVAAALAAAIDELAALAGVAGEAVATR